MFTHRILRGKYHLTWTILLYLVQISLNCGINLSKDVGICTEGVLLGFLTEDVWQAAPECRNVAYEVVYVLSALSEHLPVHSLSDSFVYPGRCVPFWSWGMASFHPPLIFTPAVFYTMYKHWEWKNTGGSLVSKQEVHWENLKKCISDFWKSFLSSTGVCLSCRETFCGLFVVVTLDLSWSVSFCLILTVDFVRPTSFTNNFFVFWKY